MCGGRLATGRRAGRCRSEGWAWHCRKCCRASPGRTIIAATATTRGDRHARQRHPAHHRQHAAHPHQPPVRQRRTASTSRASAPTRAARSRTASRWRWSRPPKRRARSSRAARSSSRPRATPASAWRWSRAVKGYKLVLVMPDSMSVERRRLMLAYGATLRADAAREGHERLDRARRRRSSRRRPAPGCRSSSTTRPTSTSTCAPRPQEIAADFPSGIDVLITGVGTGGHITGCAQVLKKMWPKLQGLRGRAERIAGDQRRQAGARIRSRASAPASSRRTCTSTCSTA